MIQKILLTRKTSLTFLSFLFLRNLNICCICCDCCYDDLFKKEYSFMWDSKGKYKDDVSLCIEKMKKEKEKKKRIVFGTQNKEIF